MGNQTTVIIRNDAIGDIRRNPEEFVKTLAEMIEHGRTGDFAVFSHGNPAQVIETHHADYTVIVAAGGNTARVIGHVYKWHWPDKIAMVKDVISSIHEWLAGQMDKNATA
jgi:hypothetical protein